ncbi:phage holin family protein [Cryptosporangium phraense]|uniref:phage holin family protein n=1 Tax=Cryptosporangium phraense TaxID=2593070 RepID=UPI001F0D0C15|nr:phage holin family protein [Cryptosporangium phraense]
MTRFRRLRSGGRRLLRGGRTATRLTLVWLVGAGSVGALSVTLPGFDIGRPVNAVVVSVVLSAINAVVWPFLMRFALAISVLTLGVGAFVLNGLLVYYGLREIPDVRLPGAPAGVLVALTVSAVTGLTSSLVGVDEDEFFHRRARRRARRRIVEHNNIPGLVMVQIDGLGHEVLQRAIRDGDVPTLARWLGNGTHRLIPWTTDWSSQTGASQCGILHGSNRDMPAFRWYEKDHGRLMVSNRPADAAEIERRHSDGRGLLHEDGASRGNLFTGDAEHKSVTLSSAGRRKGRLGAGYQGYFANPYNAVRTLTGALVDVVREVVAGTTQRQRDVRPRVPRGGIYPLVRALATVVTRDLVVEGVLDDMMAGRSVVYADLTGYDEVAHHSGIERYDSLAVLRSIDQQIGRLDRAAELAPRPYRLVVLSDHGQSQGATFAQRYGVTLEQIVQASCGQQPRTTEDSLTGPDGSTLGFAARALRRLVPPGEHKPANPGERVRTAEEEAAAREGVLVLGSGNLGLVYFTEHTGRMTLEAIQTAYPELLPTLVEHPGVAFLLVATAERGSVALGRHGAHYLESGEVRGADPLAPFGPHAPAQVRRTDSYPHVADIMINSLYDPQTDEVAAFEPLVGSHGGLGGPQTTAFLLHPVDLPTPVEPLVGPEEVHKVLRAWLAWLGHDAYADAVAATAAVEEPAPPVAALDLPFDSVTTGEAELL